MIIFKVFLILDEDEAKIVSVSSESMVLFLNSFLATFVHPNINISQTENASNSHSTLIQHDGIDIIINKILNNLSLIHKNQFNRIIVNDDNKIRFNENASNELSSNEENICADNVISNDDKNISGKSVVSDICEVLNVCAKHPHVITSDIFRQLFQTDPLKTNSIADNISTTNLPSTIDLLLQPLDYSLLYIPRAGRQCIDIKLLTGQSLLWRFQVESDYDINFGMFVHKCDIDNDSHHSLKDKQVGHDTCIVYIMNI